MGFFNDIGKKTSETTSKIAKETKLKLKISDNKGKIKELYEEIGKNIYENHINTVDDLEEIINECCARIDEYSNEIEEARKEILVLNHKKLCKRCSEPMDDNAIFCPKCGEKQDVQNEEDVKEVEVLPNDKEEGVEEENSDNN